MILGLVAALGFQQPSAGPPPAATTVAPAAVMLRAGTEIHFVTDGAIDSRSVRQGQRFTIIVAEDVAIGDTIAFPKGMRAVGEVDSVQGKGVFGKAGSLVLRPLFIELGGERINLDGTTEQRGKEQVNGAAVTTFLLGGLGLAITGKSATVPAGSVMSGRVRSDVSLPRAGPPPSATGK